MILISSQRRGGPLYRTRLRRLPLYGSFAGGGEILR